jgi:hypothetical protein
MGQQNDMTSDSILNLKPLLLGGSPSAALSACSEAAGKQVAKAAPSIDQTSFLTDVAEKIGDMFDIPLIGVMSKAWEDFRELREAADLGKQSPEEVILLPLVDYELEVSFEPSIEVEISGLPTVSVHFEIAAGLDFEGIVLEIKGAVIRAVRIGSCRATAKVTCEGWTVFERRSRELELPGEIRLASGISISSLLLAGA